MACEMILAERKQKALEAARKALLMNGATVRRNLITGVIEIQGMNTEDKNGMNDSCILAGLATDTAMQAFFTHSGITTSEIVKQHGHSHQHGTAQKIF